MPIAFARDFALDKHYNSIKLKFNNDADFKRLPIKNCFEMTNVLVVLKRKSD